MNVWNVAAAYC